MKWDRETTETAMGPFPAIVTREIDLPGGYFIRERESVGGGALATHAIELHKGTNVLARAYPRRQRWSLGINSHVWPHKISHHAFDLRKAEVFQRMRWHAEAGAEMAA